MAETQVANRRAGLKRQEALLGRLTRGAGKPAKPEAPEAEALPRAASVESAAAEGPPVPEPLAARHQEAAPVADDSISCEQGGRPAAAGEEGSAPERSSPFAKLAAKSGSSSPASGSAPAAGSSNHKVRQVDAPGEGDAPPQPATRSESRRAATPEWNDEQRPAGSAYSRVEWEAARRFGPASLDKLAELGEEVFGTPDRKAWRFHVVEYVTAKERALLYVPSAMVETEDGEAAKARLVDGRVVRESSRPPIDAGSLFLLPLDGCMLLGPAASTPFDMLAKPYSVVTHDNPPEGDEHLYPWKVRVIRPTTPPHGELWAQASMDVTLLAPPAEEDREGAPTSPRRPRG